MAKSDLSRPLEISNPNGNPFCSNKHIGKKMTAKNVHTGGCLCGAIRFEAEGPVQNPHTCSCRMCQRHTGALSAAWVEFPSAAVSWTGSGGSPSTYRSSEISSRAFCATCGSTIGAVDDEPVIAFLVGCFDDTDRDDLIAAAHSFQSGRPKWWDIRIRPGQRRPL